MSEEYTDLERELRELGPLMDEQARLEHEGPDPAFAAQLRARLVAQAAERVPTRKPRRSLSLPRLTLRWGGLGAAVAVAAVVALILLRPGGPRSPGAPGGTKSALFVPPTPSQAEITKSYPLPGGLGGGGGPVRPTQSRIELPAGQAYPGHLSLSAPGAFSTSGRVRAYRLQRAASVASRIKQIAGALEIKGPVRRIKDYDLLAPRSANIAPPMVTWLVIQQGPAGKMRSVAVSTRSGALIYHDLTADTQKVQSETPPSREAALAAGRAWLTRVGWPGHAMPPGPPYPLSVPGATTVTFGWPGVPLADRFGAALTERHGEKVDEALLLPPIQAGTSVKPRSVESAWQQVVSGKAPVAVQDYLLTGPAAPPGTGTAQAVAVQQVETQDANGRIYLVPAYRFSGTVKLRGVTGTKRWFALVPAT